MWFMRWHNKKYTELKFSLVWKGSCISNSGLEWSKIRWKIYESFQDFPLKRGKCENVRHRRHTNKYHRNVTHFLFFQVNVLCEVTLKHAEVKISAQLMNWDDLQIVCFLRVRFHINTCECCIRVLVVTNSREHSRLGPGNDASPAHLDISTIAV